jgi:hypothetical protein
MGNFGRSKNGAVRLQAGSAAPNPLCADAKDRVCRNGGDFRRAEEEGAFPVRFWCGEGPLTPAQQRKAKRDHKAAMKLMYPWRDYA